MTAYKELESAYDSLVALQADYLSNPPTKEDHAASLGAITNDFREAINNLRMQSLRIAQEAVMDAFSVKIPMVGLDEDKF